MNKFLLSLFLSICFHIGLFISASSINFESSKTNYSQKIGVSEIRTKLQFKEEAKEEIVEKLESEKLIKKKKTKKRKTEEYSDLNKSKSSSGQNSILAKYLFEIRKLIIQHKFKSRIAKRLRLTGEVEIGFSIKKPSLLGELRVIKSSGKAPLDDSALKTVMNIASFPPIPDDLGVSEVPIMLEIVYE